MVCTEHSNKSRGNMWLARLFVLLVVSVGCGSANVGSDNIQARKNTLIAAKDSFQSLGRTEIAAPSVEDLRGSLKSNMVVPFHHVEPLLNALTSGERAFEVLEENEDPSTWDFSSARVLEKATYSTTHSYTLQQPPGLHFNLDLLTRDVAHTMIRDLSARHLTHCHDPAKVFITQVSVGSILLGTVQGSWTTLPQVQKVSFLFVTAWSLYINSLEKLTISSFVFHSFFFFCTLYGQFIRTDTCQSIDARQKPVYNERRFLAASTSDESRTLDDGK